MQGHGPTETVAALAMSESKQVSDIRRVEDLYNDQILRFAGTIERIGRLGAADASATSHSRLCGSTVTVDIIAQDETVTDFAHEVRACALGQASSSIMAKHIVGSTFDELLAVREVMYRMLKHGGAPPNGRFGDLAALEPVRDYKPRHASTMLTFDAIADAIASIRARTPDDDQKAAELA